MADIAAMAQFREYQVADAAGDLIQMFGVRGWHRLDAFDVVSARGSITSAP